VNVEVNPHQVEDERLALNRISYAVRDALLEVMLQSNLFLADPSNATVDQALATLREAKALAESGPGAVDNLLLAMQLADIETDDCTMVELHDRRRHFVAELDFIDRTIETFERWQPE
jgi:hypothetical protein